MARARDVRSDRRDVEAAERDTLARLREDQARGRALAAQDRLRAEELTASSGYARNRVRGRPGELESAYEQALVDLEAARSETEWVRRELVQLLHDNRVQRREEELDRRAGERDRSASRADRTAAALDRHAAEDDRLSSAAERDQVEVDAQLTEWR